jgi:hypothetical protein
LNLVKKSMAMANSFAVMGKGLGWGKWRSADLEVAGIAATPVQTNPAEER